MPDPTSVAPPAGAVAPPSGVAATQHVAGKPHATARLGCGLGRTSTAESVLLPDLMKRMASAEAIGEVSEDLVLSFKSRMPTAFGTCATRTESSKSGINQVGVIEDYYDFGDVMGEGAFGTVYKALNKEEKVNYAVKKINLDAVVDAGRENMFETEVNISIKMTHPNVAWLVAVFKSSDGQDIFLVLELLTGGDLFDRIGWSPEGCTKHMSAVYLWAALKGVAYLHNNRICHRDIKLENFMFKDESHMSELKLMDFGLSRQYEKGKPMKSIVGTLRYAAPELLKGSYDEKCDMWSLGIVAWLIFTGCQCFDARDDANLATLIMKGEVDFTRLELWQVDANFVDITKKMLVAPEERSAAKEFADNEWLAKVATSGADKCCAIL